MEWTRSEALTLAAISCTQCHGLGLRTNRDGSAHPCNCVLRSIFRVCFNRFRHLVEKEKRYTRASLEASPKTGRRAMWGRKDEEYVADFLLVTRRTLNEAEYQLFSWHFLLGADWKLCTRRLKMDRGDFFHAVYRVQQRLGRTFRDLKPYPLYPLEDYFENARPSMDHPSLDPDPESWAPVAPNVVPIRRTSRPIQPPLRRVA
jgi:hypothetical protein